MLNNVCVQKGVIYPNAWNTRKETREARQKDWLQYLMILILPVSILLWLGSKCLDCLLSIFPLLATKDIQSFEPFPCTRYVRLSSISLIDLKISLSFLPGNLPFVGQKFSIRRWIEVDQNR